MRLLAKVLTCLPSWRGFDVVQLINPMFLELRAERISSIYHYLRRHNGSMFLGAFGMDYYWVHKLPPESFWQIALWHFISDIPSREKGAKKHTRGTGRTVPQMWSSAAAQGGPTHGLPPAGKICSVRR